LSDPLPLPVGLVFDGSFPIYVTTTVCVVLVSPSFIICSFWYSIVGLYVETVTGLSLSPSITNSHIPPRLSAKCVNVILSPLMVSVKVAPIVVVYGYDVKDHPPPVTLSEVMSFCTVCMGTIFPEAISDNFQKSSL